MDEAREQEPAPAAPGARIFRREAVEHHFGGRTETSLIELTPAWIRWAYWLLVCVCGVGLAYASVAQVREYAGGSGVIRSEGRVDVTAHLAGTVEVVSVRPGQRVTAGDQLARLYAADESATLERIDSEIEHQLVSLLRDPGDDAARNAIAALRAQRELARAQFGEHILRAPETGVVSYLGVRVGQPVEPGDLVASVSRADAGFRVLSLLPGQYRPLIRRGMAMRIEVDGYPYAYQTVAIDAVSDEVVGPAALKRYLPQSIADAVELKGPTVLVEARLPGRSFEVGGRPLELHDGMLVHAEVAVRAESVLVSLIPGLRALTGGDGAAD